MAILESFLLEIWGSGIFWWHQWAIRESENHFSINLLVHVVSLVPSLFSHTCNKLGARIVWCLISMMEIFTQERRTGWQAVRKKEGFLSLVPCQHLFWGQLFLVLLQYSVVYRSCALYVTILLVSTFCFVTTQCTASKKHRWYLSIILHFSFLLTFSLR